MSRNLTPQTVNTLNPEMLKPRTLQPQILKGANPNPAFSCETWAMLLGAFTVGLALARRSFVTATFSRGQGFF